MKETKKIDAQTYFNDPNARSLFIDENKVQCSLLSGLLFSLLGVFAVYVIPNRRTPSKLLFDSRCVSDKDAKVLDYIYQERLQFKRRQYAWIGFAIGTAIQIFTFVVLYQNMQADSYYDMLYR